MPVAASMKVLVVDDQQTMRSLVRTGLQQLGFRDIKECPDGEEALRALLVGTTHLVISDYNMPKLDGLGLLRAIRAHPPIRNTPTSCSPAAPTRNWCSARCSSGSTTTS